MALILPKCFGDSTKMEWVDDPSEMIEHVESDFQSTVELNSHQISTIAFRVIYLMFFEQLNLKVNIGLNAAIEVVNSYCEPYFTEKQHEKCMKAQWTMDATCFFLSASLSKQPDSVQFLSNWFSLRRKPTENWDANINAGFAVLYALSDLFRKKPFGEAAVSKLLPAKSPRSIKTLFEASLALVYQNNLAAASSGFTKSLESHAKTTQLTSHKERLSPLQLVAMHQSIFWNLATMKGLRIAPPPEDILPYLITKNSLSL